MDRNLQNAGRGLRRSASLSHFGGSAVGASHSWTRFYGKHLWPRSRCGAEKYWFADRPRENDQDLVWPLFSREAPPGPSCGWFGHHRVEGESGHHSDTHCANEFVLACIELPGGPAAEFRHNRIAMGDRPVEWRISKKPRRALRLLGAFL